MISIESSSLNLTLESDAASGKTDFIVRYLGPEPYCYKCMPGSVDSIPEEDWVQKNPVTLIFRDAGFL